MYLFFSSSLVLQLEKFERLSALAADFQHTAKTCGKIIISEKNLPNEYKTIRTRYQSTNIVICYLCLLIALARSDLWLLSAGAVEVGGHAGGQKYIYHGILFKFATDWLRLYGSDEYAMYALSLTRPVPVLLSAHL